jgi:hypothetical protein
MKTIRNIAFLVLALCFLGSNVITGLASGICDPQCDEWSYSIICDTYPDNCSCGGDGWDACVDFCENDRHTEAEDAGCFAWGTECEFWCQCVPIPQ